MPAGRLDARHIVEQLVRAGRRRRPPRRRRRPRARPAVQRPRCDREAPVADAEEARHRDLEVGRVAEREQADLLDSLLQLLVEIGPGRRAWRRRRRNSRSASPAACRSVGLFDQADRSERILRPALRPEIAQRIQPDDVDALPGHPTRPSTCRCRASRRRRRQRSRRAFVVAPPPADRRSADRSAGQVVHHGLIASVSCSAACPGSSACSVMLPASPVACWSSSILARSTMR